MYTIQLNEKGTRTIEISEENLQTIEKFLLFRDLVDSTGYVTEAVLDKLRLNIRSLIAHQTENSKDLLDLCIDVIYHDSMKAFGLKNLILLYLDWKQNASTNKNILILTGNSTEKGIASILKRYYNSRAVKKQQLISEKETRF